jgi:hypothetical protein
VTVVDTEVGQVEREAQRLALQTQRRQQAQNARNAEKNRPLISAARTIDVSNAAAERKRIKRVTQPGSREEDAWTYYDYLSEIKEGGRFIERSLSKLRLYPAVQVSPSTDPVPLDTLDSETDLPYVTDQAAIGLAQQTYERIDGGYGTGHLTGRWGTVGFVAGDSYLIGYKDPTANNGERFVLVTPDNLKVTDREQFALAMAPDAGPTEWLPLPLETSLITRVWNQHARWPDLADSAVLGVLDICEKVLILSNLEYGTATSHLNAGVLLFPHGILGKQLEHPDDDTGPDTAGNQTRNPTAQDIVNQMLTPISDPRSVAVAAPAILEADPGLIEKVRHVLLQRPFDATAAAMLDKAITRLANGVSLPREVLLGMTNATNWTAWMIDDQTWRAYLEPVAREFVQAATGGTFRPLLLADWKLLGYDENRQIGTGPDGRKLTIRNLCLWMDATSLVGDPDEVDNVFKGWDTGLLGSAPARQKIGWSEGDAPTDEDTAHLLALKRGREAVGPGGEPIPTDTTGQMPDPALAKGGAGEGLKASAQLALTAAARPRNRFAGYGAKWAARDAALMNRLLSQADTAMSRALDRAGAKLRTKATKAGDAHTQIVQAAGNRDVGSLLGPGVVASLDLSPDELLDGSFDELATRFRSGVGRSQVTTLSDLQRAGLDDAAAADLERTQAQHRDAATAAFTAAMLALATQRIFDPHPAAPAAGEHDVELSVPSSLIRQSLAVAGGATGRPAAGGAFQSGPLDEPADGLALGVDVTSTVASMGATIVTWTWDYGDPSSRTSQFEPHENLAGVTFENWDDDALLNDSDWVVATHYFPGDHLGCQCQAIPDIVGAEADIPEPDDG